MNFVSSLMVFCFLASMTVCAVILMKVVGLSFWLACLIGFPLGYGVVMGILMLMGRWGNNSPQ